MAASPSIVLTNDDGIDSPGLLALRDALAEVGSVTVVAPATDQSAVGRAMSNEVTVTEQDLGYAIDGTPADCVVAALQSLVPDADLVVSGCNEGANLGMYVLGRSGTVSAAVEAAFFGVPSLAVSLYVPQSEWGSDLAASRYGDAARATRRLADQAPAAGVFETADYLNVNVPLREERVESMSVTRPSRAYAMDAERDGGRVTLHDRMWEEMAAGEADDPPGTDRHAVTNGAVSVSPLTAPHTTERHEALDELAAAF